MIKWIVVALLVAGSFGVIWTAPWKDDVDRLTARAKDAVATLDQKTGGDCRQVGKNASSDVQQAVDALRSEAADDQRAKDAARRQADQIAACLKRVPDVAPSWREIERRLRSAAQ